MLSLNHPTLNIQVRSDGWIYRPALRNRKACWTRGYLDGTGYYRVRVDGKIYRVHRLVAETFIPNPAGLPEIDHINRDRSDNRVENLRWATRSENTRNTKSSDHCKEQFGVHKYEDAQEYNRLRAARYSKTDSGKVSRAKYLARYRKTHTAIRCADGKYHKMTRERAKELLKLKVSERYV